MPSYVKDETGEKELHRGPKWVTTWYL